MDIGTKIRLKPIYNLQAHNGSICLEPGKVYEVRSIQQAQILHPGDGCPSFTTIIKIPGSKQWFDEDLFTKAE